MNLAGVAEGFVEALAAAVADRCTALLARPAYYSQNTSPLPRESYLAAAARQDFPTWKHGKLVFARSADVHRFIETESHRYRRAPRDHRPPEAAPSLAERSLAAAGLGVANDDGRMEQVRRLGRRT